MLLGKLAGPLLLRYLQEQLDRAEPPSLRDAMLTQNLPPLLGVGVVHFYRSCAALLAASQNLEPYKECWVSKPKEECWVSEP